MAMGLRSKCREAGFPFGRSSRFVSEVIISASLMKKSIGNSRSPIGLAGIGHQLPECIKPLDQLESEGRISSPASLLRGFGFENCRIQEDRQEGSDLLLRSTQQA